MLAYICDLDGTLADLTHRLHFISGEIKAWDSFYQACFEDRPIPEVIQTIQLLDQAGARILIVSGRSSSVKDETIAWLAQHKIPCHVLYMRREGDHRHDFIVKGEMLDLILEEFPLESILGVFDDRKQVVEMFRKRGLRVFQVAEGDF